jgi:hypothetical protein
MGRARDQKAFLFLALLLHGLFLVSLGTGWLDPLFVEASEGHGQASDFFGIYQAAYNLRAGYSIYDSADYRDEAPEVVPFAYFYRYLPPTAALLSPLTLLLRPWPAYWLWVLWNEILILLVLRSLLRWERWPRERRWTAAGLWLVFTPLYIEQVMGQFSLTMAALLWAVWRHEETPPGSATRPYRWQEDRAGPARVFWAWVASLNLKSFSVLLAFPYLRDRRLRRLLLAAAVTLAVNLPYFLWRPEDLVEFLRLNLDPFSPRILKGCLGFRNLLRALLVPAFPQAVEVAGRQVALGALLVRAVSLPVLAAALAATWRLRGVRDRFGLDLAVWVGAFFLLFQSIWEYHYVMLLPALAAAYLMTGSRIVRVLWILLALPTLYAAAPLLAGIPARTPFADWPRWLQVLHLSTKSLPAVVFFAWCCLRAWGRRPLGEGA